MTTNPPPPPASPDEPSDTVGSATDAVADPAPRHPTATFSDEKLPDESPTGPAPTSAGFGAPPPTGAGFRAPPPPASGGFGSGTGSPWTTGPPPGHDQPPRRSTPRLQRSSSDRVLTGVCGGLGRHTGVDPILFRIGFVALVFAAGTGVLLYLALAVLMPRDDGQQIWARGSDQRSGAGSFDPPSGTEPYTPPVPRGPRSPVPGVTLAILLIGLGVVALGESYGDWSLDLSAYFAMAVATIGVALLVSAFGPWRRSKAGLIALGLILSFGLFVTSAVDQRGGFGDGSFSQRDYRPRSANEVRDTYQVVMGQSTLDLSGVQFTAARPVEIQVEVTMGDFHILLPRAADVQLNGDAVFGSVAVFGNRDVFDGYYKGIGEGPGVGDADPEIILSLDVRFGNAEVTRVG